MVASASQVYSPSYHSMHSDEGAQSSEEGSGLHSPDFVAPFSPSGPGDNFRYHQHDPLDVQRSAGVLLQPYDYPLSLGAQPPPLLDPGHDLPSSSSAVSFSSQYPVLPSRNQFGREFPAHHQQLHSRVHHEHVNISNPVDLRYTSSPESRLPGNLPHDPSVPRQLVNTPDADHRPPGTTPASQNAESPTNSATTSASKPPRKEISNVVIACRQCRGRKIRCDSTRPICQNCVRRSNVCEYDAAPKRRGPDKRPGTRQRSCKKRPADGSAPPPPKRRRTTTIEPSQSPVTISSPTTSKVKENVPQDRRSSSSSSRYQDHASDSSSQSHLRHGAESIHLSPEGLSSLALEQHPSGNRQYSYRYESAPYIKSAYPRPLDINIMRSKDVSHQKFPPPPSGKHDQKVWWSTFLASTSLEEVENELRFLVKDSGHALSFLNVDFVIKRLYSEEHRLLIQPAFVYAVLAMATLMKSSELESRAPGRERAQWLRNSAQFHIEDSWSKNWIDATLAEAALIIALYETSAHEHYSPERAEAALILMDNIIRRINLTMLDQNDRDVCSFSAGTVPIIHLEPISFSNSNSTALQKKCSCIPSDSAHPPNPYTSWSYSLPWDQTWTDAQTRDEECRRLCWSALSLVCGYVSQCIAFERDLPNFFLTDAGNYALLFPGEVLDRMSPSYRATDSMSTKESIWGLYCRSMLLWTFTNRMRANLNNSDEQVDQIFDAWSEVQSIQDSLRMHDCNLDTGLMYLCREYIFNTRMSITQALRSLQGLVPSSSVLKRKHAEDWLFYQGRVIQLVKATINHLGTVQGHELTRRPQQVNWFVGQLSICLVLWNQDRSLENALVLGKSFLFAAEVMNNLWPCHLLQRQSLELRERLILACTTVGIEPPTPLSYTLPSL